MPLMGKDARRAERGRKEFFRQIQQIFGRIAGGEEYSRVVLCCFIEWDAEEGGCPTEVLLLCHVGMALEHKVIAF